MGPRQKEEAVSGSRYSVEWECDLVFKLQAHSAGS